MYGIDAAKPVYNQFTPPIPTMAITEVHVEKCQHRGAVLCRFVCGKEEISYFLSQSRVTLEEVKNNIRKTLMSSISIDRAVVFLNGRKFQSGFLNTSECITRSINTCF